MLEIRRMETADALSVYPLMRGFYDRCLGRGRYSEDLIWNNIDRCTGSYPHLEGWVMTDRVVVMGYAMVSFGYETAAGRETLRVEELYVDRPFRATDAATSFLRGLTGLYPEAMRASVEAGSRQEAEIYKRCGYLRHTTVLSTMDRRF